jgi:transcriptional regulator with XRE-family HTH domain
MNVPERIQGRLDRLELSVDDAARAAGMPAVRLRRVLADEEPVPRGTMLVKLAEALDTSVAYLVGLEPDDPVPDSFLQDDQGELGLLASDETALLEAYRRLDVATRAALLRVALKMSPPPEEPEAPTRTSSRRRKTG